MTTYVLVHGSWGGGWCWDRVAPSLRSAGHEVHTPTLTGLGCRAHLAGPLIDLSTHVDDVVSLLDRLDLQDVVLVGHSYGGMVITGVAGRVPRRLAHLVYLDAFRPTPGQSAFDLLPELRQIFEPPASVTPWGIPQPDWGALGVDDVDDAAWLRERSTPMPSATHEEPLPPPPAGAPSIPETFVEAAALPLFRSVAQSAAAAGATVLSWTDAAHMLLLTHPGRVVSLLTSLDAPAEAVS